MGVKPNQNPQERAHGVMKSTANGKLHSSTEYCINHTIPEMMANFRDATNHSYVAEDGPLPNDMIVKAYTRQSSRFNQLQKGRRRERHASEIKRCMKDRERRRRERHASESERCMKDR